MKIYTPSEIKEVEKIDIVSFCEAKGIEVIRTGNKYYRLAEHDSLVINTHSNYFVWNSQQVAGNVINFVQSYYDCNFYKAMQILSAETFSTTNTEKQIKEQFIYDINTVDDTSKIERYLDKRGISTYLSSLLIGLGLINQDDKGNVVFNWFKDEEIVGYTLNGVYKYKDKKTGKRKNYKKIGANSELDYGFNFTFGNKNNADNLYIFESEIDLLSYLTLFPKKAKNSTFLSMNGLKKQTVLSFIIDYFTVNYDVYKNIYLCVDNDEAGLNFIKTMKDSYEQQLKGTDKVLKFSIDIPEKRDNEVKKDWNDIAVSLLR